MHCKFKGKNDPNDKTDTMFDMWFHGDNVNPFMDGPKNIFAYLRVYGIKGGFLFPHPDDLEANNAPGGIYTRDYDYTTFMSELKTCKICVRG